MAAHVRLKQLTRFCQTARVALYDSSTAGYNKEVMQESSENVLCVACQWCLNLIRLGGRIMTQHLVKGAAMTSSQQQTVVLCPHPSPHTHQPKALLRAVMSSPSIIAISGYAVRIFNSQTEAKPCVSES